MRPGALLVTALRSFHEQKRIDVSDQMHHTGLDSWCWTPRSRICRCAVGTQTPVSPTRSTTTLPHSESVSSPRIQIELVSMTPSAEFGAWRLPCPAT